MERTPDDCTIEIKIRFKHGASLWTALASNAVALGLVIYDLLSWLIK
jgi:hypothetical protein